MEPLGRMMRRSIAPCLLRQRPARLPHRGSFGHRSLCCAPDKSHGWGKRVHRLLGPETLHHGVYALAGLSLLFADILMLRGFALLANALALVDVHLIRPKATQMSRLHARWNWLYLATNMYWVSRIVNERFAWLDAEEERLYCSSATIAQAFTRPQFSAFVRKGTRHTATEPTVLIDEGQPADVFLILQPEKMSLHTNGRTIEFTCAEDERGAGTSAVEPSRPPTPQQTAPPLLPPAVQQAAPASSHAALPTATAPPRPDSRLRIALSSNAATTGGTAPILVGEGSYLMRSAASASVAVEAGCTYLKWERGMLDSLEDSNYSLSMNSSSDLHKAVQVWLGLGLAKKLRQTTATFCETMPAVEEEQGASAVGQTMLSRAASATVSRVAARSDARGGNAPRQSS